MLLWTLRYVYPLELVLPFFFPRYILRSGLARLPLCFLNGNFWWTEILNFDGSSISHFFSFSVNAFYVLFEENLFLPQDMKIFFLEPFLFHHSHFIFFCRLLGKLIFFSCFPSYPNWKTICWKDDPFPLSKNQLTICSYFSGFSTLLHWYIYLNLCQDQSFFNTEA